MMLLFIEGSGVLCGINDSTHEQQTVSGFMIQKEKEGAVHSECGG